MATSVLQAVLLAIALLLCISSAECLTVDSFIEHSQSYDGGLCLNLVEPCGYTCSEHTGGDAWFMDSAKQSLGFILADHGFDVWVGNVCGTKWSHGHVSLSEGDKDFWDWSWQELALYDLETMLSYIKSETSSKVFVVGHSQGTIMSLAAFTQPDIANLVEAASLLSPISYLDHITSNDILTNIIDLACDGHLDCSDMLAPITGENCCFNSTRVDFYLEYEPHRSSLKNLKHLFQMIRKGTFAKYDYGILKNVLQYGQTNLPSFDLSQIPQSLPIWMAHGGNDALISLQRN